MSIRERHPTLDAILRFFEQPDGSGPPAQPPEVSADTAQPSGSELLSTLEMIGDRWHCPRSSDDLRTWIWNLQVTLAEVELAAIEDLENLMQIDRQLQQHPEYQK